MQYAALLACLDCKQLLKRINCSRGNVDTSLFLMPLYGVYSSALELTIHLFRGEWKVISDLLNGGGRFVVDWQGFLASIH